MSAKPTRPGWFAKTRAGRWLAKHLLGTFNPADMSEAAPAGGKIERQPEAGYESLLGGRFAGGRGPLSELRRLEFDALQNMLPMQGGRVRTVEGGLRESVYPGGETGESWEIVEVPFGGAPRVIDVVRGPEADAIKMVETKRHLAESAYPPEVTQVDGLASNAPDYQYRRLTGQKERDLLPLTQLRQLQIAYFIWTQNPLGNRIPNIMRDYVVGDGFTYTARDTRVKEVLDDFWNDPVNDLEEKQDVMVLELGLFGELIRPAFISEHDGSVKLGYVDPLQCVEARTDPDNVEIVRTLVLAQRLDSPTRKELTVVNVDNDPTSQTHGYLKGECFFWTVNKVSNATRGRSDLCHLLDWIDGYDQFTFSQMDRALLLQSFIWDVTLQGFDENQCNDWLKKQGAVPRPGSVRAHNEKVVWTAVAPDLKANDASGLAKLLRLPILAGSGLADWMLGEGGGTTRTTAREMTDVTVKTFQRRQKRFKWILKQLFNFVIDQAILHGRLPKDQRRLKEEFILQGMDEKAAAKKARAEGIDRGFTIRAPRILERDSTQMSAALNTTTTALVTAMTNRLIRVDQAAKVFFFLLDQLGVEMSEDRERDISKLVDEEDVDPEQAAIDYSEEIAKVNPPPPGGGGFGGGGGPGPLQPGAGMGGDRGPNDSTNVARNVPARENQEQAGVISGAGPGKGNSVQRWRQFARHFHPVVRDKEIRDYSGSPGAGAGGTAGTDGSPGVLR